MEKETIAIVDSVEALEKKLAEIREAQRKFATYTQEQVDAIFLAAALAAAVIAGKITHNTRLPLAPFICGAGMAAVLFMEAFPC